LARQGEVNLAAEHDRLAAGVEVTRRSAADCLEAGVKSGGGWEVCPPRLSLLGCLDAARAA
jgi:hypothetical protein